MIKTTSSSSGKKTPDPVFNEAFTFHIPVERVQDSELEIRLSLSEGGNSDAVILGKVSAGANSITEVGQQHWSKMLNSPRHPVAEWHSFATSPIL